MTMVSMKPPENRVLQGFASKWWDPYPTNRGMRLETEEESESEISTRFDGIDDAVGGVYGLELGEGGGRLQTTRFSSFVSMPACPT